LKFLRNLTENLIRVVYALGHNSINDMSVTPTGLYREERGILRAADAIVHDKMRELDLYREISQLPVVLLPLSFGVESLRSLVLRPVLTSTFLTAKALTGNQLPEQFFIQTADKILRQIVELSQIFAEITGKPPGRTEWE